MLFKIYSIIPIFSIKNTGYSQNIKNCCNVQLLHMNSLYFDISVYNRKHPKKIKINLMDNINIKNSIFKVITTCSIEVSYILYILSLSENRKHHILYKNIQ